MMRITICSVLAISLLQVTTALAQFEQLAEKVRPEANAVMAIDVAALKASAFGKKHGWADKLEGAYADRTIFLPPRASQVLVASQLLLDQDFQAAWEVAVLKMQQTVSMGLVARAEGGEMDTIGGMQIVRTAHDAYIIPLGGEMLGVLSPANRQGVATWIKQVKEPRSGALPPYLAAAIRRVTGDTQIVLAIDLENVASAEGIAAGLQDSAVVKDEVLNVADVAALLESIRGVSVDVSVDAEVRVESRVEFGMPVKFSDAIAKRLVLEILAAKGLQMPELEQHRFRVAGSSIRAEGSLSAAGLRRLLSLLDVPANDITTVDSPSSGQPPTTAETMAKASQQYYKSVVDLLDDLRTDREKKDVRGGMDGVWMERYSKKIDRLPLLNVDPELLDWGGKTAETLRIMSQARKNAGLSAGSQKSELRSGFYVDGSFGYSYGYGYANGVTVSGTTARGDAANRNQITTQTQNAATTVRVEGWRLIDDATANVRKAMTQRYQLEF